MTRRLGEHAVVTGASVAGLVAARVLSEFFERVTLVERDRKPGAPVPRKGVPQSRHVHAVLAGGALGFERLFPGLQAELIAEGATRVDFLNEVAFFQNGWLGPAEGRRLDMLFLGRPLLESRLDARVQRIPEVALREETRASGCSINASGAVDGVILDGGREVLEADFVVDATGRGSRTPVWLVEQGFDAPPEEEVRLPLSYTSRIFEARDPAPWWKALFVFDELEGNRSGGVFPIEGGHWLVTLIGVAGQPAPKTDDDFLAFAKALAVPELHRAIEDATALTPPTTYRFPASLRRRYERCRRIPGRFAVLGDAVCSFDPRFGQGMSIAVLEALALQKTLAAIEGALDSEGPGIARAIAQVVDLAWAPVLSEGLRHPAAVGKRTWRIRAMQWYSRRVMERQVADPVLKETLWRVSQFVEPPTALLRPRILRSALRPKLAHAAAMSPTLARAGPGGRATDEFREAGGRRAKTKSAARERSGADRAEGG